METGIWHEYCIVFIDYLEKVVFNRDNNKSVIAYFSINDQVTSLAAYNMKKLKKLKIKCKCIWSVLLHYH